MTKYKGGDDLDGRSTAPVPVPGKKQATFEAMEREIIAFIDQAEAPVLSLHVPRAWADEEGASLIGLEDSGLFDGVTIAPGQASDVSEPFATLVARLQAAFSSVGRPDWAIDASCPDMVPPVFDETLPHPVAAAAFVEQAAAMLWPALPRLVIVVVVDDRTHVDARVALSVFVHLLRSPFIRLIIVDGSTAPVVPAGTPALRRIDVIGSGSGSADPQGELEGAFWGHHRTVVVAEGATNAIATLLKRLVRGPVIEWQLPCSDRRDLEESMASEAEALARKARLPGAAPVRVRPLPRPDVPALEWCLATLDWLRHATAPDADLVVIIDPEPAEQPERLAKVVEALGELPLRPRVRLLVLDADGRVGPAISGRRLRSRLLQLGP